MNKSRIALIFAIGMAIIFSTFDMSAATRTKFSPADAKLRQDLETIWPPGDINRTAKIEAFLGNGVIVSGARAILPAASQTDGGTEMDPINVDPSPYTFYNFPLFTAPPGWSTINTPNTYFPWYFNNSTRVNTNGCPSVESTHLAYGGARAVYKITMIDDATDYNKYGNPTPHKLSFWYRGNVSSIDTYSVYIGGVVLTNLPSTANWTHVTLNIPASPIHTNEFSWVVRRGFNGTTSPYGALDAPQIYPVYPEGTDPDFNISRIGTNMVVKWRSILFGASFLSSSTNLLSGYETNANYHPVYSNQFMWVSVPVSDQQRYFRLYKP